MKHTSKLYIVIQVVSDVAAEDEEITALLNMSRRDHDQLRDKQWDKVLV